MNVYSFGAVAIGSGSVGAGPAAPIENADEFLPQLPTTSIYADNPWSSPSGPRRDPSLYMYYKLNRIPAAGDYARTALIREQLLQSQSLPRFGVPSNVFSQSAPAIVNRVVGGVWGNRGTVPV